MAYVRLTEEEIQRRADVIHQHTDEYGHIKYADAARALGLKFDALRHWWKENARHHEKTQKLSQVTFPKFHSGEVDEGEILDYLDKRHKAARIKASSESWFEVKVKGDLPIGMCWFGDPHIGDDGSDISLLRKHIASVTKTEGLYGANLGDSVNNWSSKLVHLYAHQPTTRADERALARWFLKKSGIPWLIWLEGNHDNMAPEFATYLRTINASCVPMLDWRARFRLTFKNKRTFRIDAAHDHKGHSMWNTLHGQTRAAVMDEHADLYIAGHRHTAARAVIEMPGGRVVNLVRARGYKFIDDYARRWQFPEQSYGASMVTIFDPNTDNPMLAVRVEPDVEEAAEILKWMRKRAKK